MKPPSRPNDEALPPAGPSQLNGLARDRGRPKIVVLIGASIRAAAESAVASGYTVIGLDAFGDTDTQQACKHIFSLGDNDSDTDSVEAAECLAALPTATRIVRVGGLDAQILQSVLDRYPKLTPCHCRSDPDIDQLSDYCRGTRILFPECVPVAECVPADTSPSDAVKDANPGSEAHPVSEAHSMNRADPGNESRWLYKRRGSSGGLGVTFRKHLSPDWYRQKRVAGVAIGVTAFASGDAVRLLGVCQSKHRRITDHPFVYAGSVGPFPISDSLTEAILPVAENFAADFHYRGCFNLDLIVDREDLHLLEINARYSASMELLERALRISVVGLSIEAHSEPITLPDHQLDWTTVYEKEILYADAEFVYTPRSRPTLQIAGGTLHDLPVHGTVIPRGQPICTRISRRPLNGSVNLRSASCDT